MTIDDDVLATAELAAMQQDCSIGEVISTWARQALLANARPVATRNGVPLLPKREGGRPVDQALVNRLRDGMP